MAKLMVHGKTARNCLARGVARLAAAVEPTLGPKGLNAMVDRPVGTPLVTRDRLFLWGDDGVVTCLNVSSGATIWRERVGGTFYGSPVCVDNRLYCIARDGVVVVLAASDRFEVPARVPLGEASYATPAVSGGVMYLRTHSQLFSIGGKRP